MSDYGGAVSIGKRDESEFAPDEHERVKAAVLEIKKQKKYTSVNGEFLFDLGYYDKKFDLMLVTYWYGDVSQTTADKNYETARTHDTPLIEEIAQKLTDLLGPAYSIQPYFSRW